MVSMTLIQGVMNTFVVFLSRVIAYAVDKAVFKRDSSEGPSFVYTIMVIALDILLGILAALITMWFSRRREFRADADAARLMGSPEPMIAALRRLGSLHGASDMPKEMAALGFSGNRMMSLLSSHPSIESRITALRSSS
jgi:heat shock protein HtpX